ncbi:MAG: hypothetical protein GY948_07860 [Alphaproteobacteria bacterium]|nr:hypothetical protein [Alphaproteobacteria bacterium]
MIITCPDCATSYELPDTVIGDEGKLVQCEGCRKIWTHMEPLPESELIFDTSPSAEGAEIPDPVAAASPQFYEPNIEEGPLLETSADAVDFEINEPEQIETLEFEEIPDAPGTALVVVEAPAHEPPPAAEPLETINVKSEAARLARASASAKLAFQRKRQNRMKTIRGWCALAASVVVLTAPAVAFPRQVTVLFPAAAQLYAKAGVNVNTRGLEFREISYRRVLEEGALVLEIEGKVVNVSQVTHELAPLHVSLLDDHKQSLYSWTLNAEPETVDPDGAATFKTRLAAPPSDATNLRVRFALPNETH